jgi:uncharacterized protein YdhG (YjbR/CyaY superfamily)
MDAAVKARRTMTQTGRSTDRPATVASIDAYIEAAAPAVRAHLQAIRDEVRRVVPAATETISYQLPAFRLARVFFYFAAFKHHIGVYPPVRGDADLQAELHRYRGPKGNLKFPLTEPLPLELIGRVAVVLAGEVGGR